MGLNQTAVTKFGCTITTVDPATNQIEGVTRTGSPVNATVVHTGVAWRWPVVGEQWMARQENGQWFLDGPMSSDPNSTAAVTLFDVPPGDAIINTPTGIVHVMGGADGSTDFTISGTPLEAANNLSDVVNTSTARTNLGFARGSSSFTGNSATNIQITITHTLNGTPTFATAVPLFEGVTKLVSVGPTTFVIQFDLLSAAGAVGTSPTFQSFGTSSWSYRWFACL
jgi:hypothetical protein